MNKIKIGGIEKSLSDITESWITQQVHNRQNDGQPVCAQLFLEMDGLQMILSTPQCGGGGGGRTPNAKELDLFNRWNERHLNQSDWTVGNLIAFLKQTKLLH